MDLDALQREIGSGTALHDGEAEDEYDEYDPYAPADGEDEDDRQRGYSHAARRLHRRYDAVRVTSISRSD